MKPMTEAHFAILRRHMVEVIALQADLMSEEIGKASLGEPFSTPCGGCGATSSCGSVANPE